MSTVGSLVVDLSANVAKFQSDMGKAAAIAEERLSQIDKMTGIVKGSLVALGAGFAASMTFDALKSKIEGAIESAAGLQQLSERTGATVEALSGLVSVAKLSDTGMEELATGLQKLSKSSTPKTAAKKPLGHLMQLVYQSKTLKTRNQKIFLNQLPINWLCTKTALKKLPSCKTYLASPAQI